MAPVRASVLTAPAKGELGLQNCDDDAKLFKSFTVMLF